MKNRNNFFIVNGNEGLGIEPMDMEELLILIYNALPALASNPDYPDFMNSIVDIAEHK